MCKRENKRERKCACVCTCRFESKGMCVGERHTEIDPKRCKTSSVGQSAGLLILRSSVRFRQKPKKKNLRTQIYMDLSYVDPQARVLNYFYK